MLSHGRIALYLRITSGGSRTFSQGQETFVQILVPMAFDFFRSAASPYLEFSEEISRFGFEFYTEKKFEFYFEA